MEFNVEATLFSEKNMLFTLKDGEHHADCRIGHVRGDFGSNGNEFHHTWWSQHEELNTDEFKTELTQVVNELRSDSCGLLKSRKSMQSFCCDHARAKLLGHWNSETYGFKICTEKYMYYIKAFYGTGDYNFYINCFVRDRELEKRCDELDVLNGIFSAMKMDDRSAFYLLPRDCEFPVSYQSDTCAEMCIAFRPEDKAHRMRCSCWQISAFRVSAIDLVFALWFCSFSDASFINLKIAPVI